MDNPALAAANVRGGEVIPAYILSDWKKSHRWTGSARQQFLCDSLASLDGNLRSVGSRLVVRCGDAVEELEKLIRESEADALYFNRDVDPFGVAKQREVAAMAAKYGCEVHAFHDASMHGPEVVLKQDGSPYRVFTPYFKSWQTLDKAGAGGRLRSIATPEDVDSLPLPTLDHWGLPAAPQGILDGGEKAARERVNEFFDGTVFRYAADRNTPAGRTTSRLSQDLRFGLLSIRELHARSVAALEGADASGRKGVQHFISELCWREFYFQILHHYPEVLEAEFNPQFRGMEWESDDEAFEAWKDGRTGFPVVDAAMRELKTTGFMHNRTRMIAAMFLTKDLHIDWREGEKYFMQALVDGEIASNNGGWQWSAGTGADAAPYFRIQNPWTQTKRYDPDGAYIRRFVPELEGVDAKRFMEPPPDGGTIAKGYAAPIVDHATERERTLAAFARHKADIAPREV